MNAFVMNYTEDKQQVVFASVVKDIVTGEELTGEVTLEKYEVKLGDGSCASIPFGEMRHKNRPFVLWNLSIIYT